MRHALWLVVLALGCGGKVEAGSSLASGGSGGTGGTAGAPASGGWAGVGGSTGGSGGVQVGGSAGQGGTPTDPCSLSLVSPSSAGEFNPQFPTVDALDGPATVATSSGFLAAYSANDASTFHMIPLFIDDQGVLTTSWGVNWNCSAPVNRGITAGWSSSGQKGLLGVASPCAENQEYSELFWTFDGQGQQLTPPPNPVGPNEIRFQSMNGAVGAQSDGSFLVASLKDSGAGLVPTYYDTAYMLFSEAKELPAFSETANFAAIAADTGIVALLANAHKSDATLLYTAPPNGKFSLSSLPMAKFGVLAALGDRALAAFPSPKGVEWSVRDSSGQELGAGVLSVKVKSLAAVGIHDHFILAIGLDNTITLHRLDGATGTIQPAPAVTVVLPAKMGSTSLDPFDGNRLSLSAARDRVLVTWLRGTDSAQASKATLGYALLKCAAP